MQTLMELHQDKNLYEWAHIHIHVHFGQPPNRKTVETASQSNDFCPIKNFQTIQIFFHKIITGTQVQGKASLHSTNPNKQLLS